MTNTNSWNAESAPGQISLFPLSQRHRRYIIADFVFGMIPNAILSGIGTFFIFRHLALVPLWGKQGMAFDFAPTVFLITLGQLTVCTLLTRKRVRAGVIPAIGVSRRRIPALRMLPHNVVLRGLIVAMLATIVLPPLSIAAMLALRIEALPLGIFVTFKTVYGPVVGLVTAPIIYLAALTDLHPSS